MTSRIVRIGRQAQVITTRWVAGTLPGFTERHEHVTLETPKAHSDTARLRLLTAKELGQSFPS
jgi:hypothetical protein